MRGLAQRSPGPALDTMQSAASIYEDICDVNPRTCRHARTHIDSGSMVTAWVPRGRGEWGGASERPAAPHLQVHCTAPLVTLRLQPLAKGSVLTAHGDHLRVARAVGCEPCCRALNDRLQPAHSVAATHDEDCLLARLEPELSLRARARLAAALARAPERAADGDCGTGRRARRTSCDHEDCSARARSGRRSGARARP
jgi:hypothetical protein